MLHRALPAFLIVLSLSWPSFAEAAKAAGKVIILEPMAETALTGRIPVKAKVTFRSKAKTIPVVCASLGGRWVHLKQTDEKDVWAGILDSTMVPNGDRELHVFAGGKRVRKSVKTHVKNPLNLYFADLHSHTSFSDGTLIPEVAHRYARDEAKLDIFSLTDHLEQVDDDEWFNTREVADDFNEDGKFVTLPGLEWTKKWGHLNIFDPKKRRWPKSPDKIYETLAAAEVVAKFNHPHDGTKDHGALKYSPVGDKAVQMMEVRSKNEQKAFIRALNLGWHIAPDGSDDTHKPNWGQNRTWTGVLAPGLSRLCIWDAMKKRHLYSTHDRNCRLGFEVNGAVMGDIIEKPVREVNLTVCVNDPDPKDTITKIELFEDGEVVETDKPVGTCRQWTLRRSPKPGPHYYFVKVTQTDGNPMWSAPIWLTVSPKP